MSNPPAGKPNLSKPLVAGVVLAIIGVLLFFGVYIALASAEPVVRLLVAMCVPPAVIAAIVGAYVLIARPGRS